jgi:hypothetical protein
MERSAFTARRPVEHFGRPVGSRTGALAVSSDYSLVVQPAVAISSEKVTVGEIGRPATPETTRQPIAFLTHSGQVGDGHAPKVIKEP